MRETRLILVEGLPGSGKSTTAHLLSRHLQSLDVSVRWWYEEEVGHPVYVFQDDTSLRQTLDDLNAGRFRVLIEAALAQWRQFVALLTASGEIGLIDSCLYGYLTWSLFPHGAPESEIQAYVAAVEQIVAPLDPCLIYFRQEDVARSLRRLVDRRGGITEQRFVQKAVQSEYGQRRQLAGFDGMVAYWTAYRQVTDTAFARSSLPRLAIETSAGDWPTYRHEVLAFLDLPPLAEVDVPAVVLQEYVGMYTFGDGDGHDSATVSMDGDALILDGVPCVWPRSRLLPRLDGKLDVESLPFAVRFERDAFGTVVRMVIAGPELLGGSPPAVLTRQ
jgi:thymidylate kinase